MATLTSSHDARRLAWTVVGITAALIAGCGDSGSERPSPQGDRAEIRQVVRDYHAAYAAGDGRTACSTLVGELQRGIVDYLEGDVPNPPTCEDALREHSKRFGPDEKAHFTNLDLSRYKLTIRGYRATFREPDGTKVIVLTKDPNAGWLLSAIYVDEE